MALFKKIKSDNGITGTYHRIGSITKNHSELSVEVESYADSTYREWEKELLSLASRKDYLISSLSILTGSPITKESQQEIDEINDFFDHYQELCKIKDFCAFKTNVSLDWDFGETISFETIYKELAETETIFSGAELAE